MQVQIGKQTYQLLSEKAIFRAIDATLIIADLHLGKAQHFRKNGISIPQKSAEKDYERLAKLLQHFTPQRVILLGDLFHSDYNHEWNLFCDFVNAFNKIKFLLVLGNHDILEEAHYKKVCLTVVEKVLDEGDVIFSHHPLKKVAENKINIAGHIHPGILLSGKGKQHMQLPCFYFYKNQLILPAFGSLTGLQLMEIKKESSVYVIAGKNVVAL